MDDLRELFELTAAIAADFYETLPERPVYPRATVAELHAALSSPLPEQGLPARTVIAELAAAADPGIVAEASGRYFGFVVGGAVPASIAADWLTSTWDQNAGLFVLGPSASIVEQAAGAWLIELLGLPRHASFGFVTGAQMANFTALAAARHHVLARAGWDVERDGLQGAPRIRVVVGAKRHGTIDRALRMLGLGAPTDVVPADSEGRMLASELQLGDEPTIVCAQAGEVNTGASDPFHAIADARDAAANAWIHVDGAFGLWAAATDSLRHYVDGAERCDSWATDAHKWLNVPYDSGLVFTAHPDSHSAAFSARATYLIVDDDKREQLDWNPEHSRRARGFAVYAAIRSLGRTGIAELIERTCAHARTFAARLEVMGAEVMNGVELNQVLIRFPDDARTEAVLAAVQASGEAWLSGTVWEERPAIRISVSNWQTSDDDVERTLAAFRELAPA
ncbi:MAG TPA: pyridoxal-dependent decarboxylase [Gaiellaceae bacterium]|jgi:glutamate/tyrosine decarboxylase-like PLP-dependent enzyme